VLTARLYSAPARQASDDEASADNQRVEPRSSRSILSQRWHCPEFADGFGSHSGDAGWRLRNEERLKGARA
jgi:hypothetical protein